jgi:hypothetical protein
VSEWTYAYECKEPYIVVGIFNMNDYATPDDAEKHDALPTYVIKPSELETFTLGVTVGAMRLGYTNALCVVFKESL